MKKYQPFPVLITILLTVSLLGLAVFVGCSKDSPTDLGQESRLVGFDPAKEEVTYPPRPTGNVGDEEGGKTVKALGVTDLTEGLTPLDLAEYLLGSGPNAPIISNVTFTGASNAAGILNGGETVFGFDTGVVLSSGSAKLISGPNEYDNTTVDNGLAGDPELDSQIASYTTYDATILEFDFECPVLNVISFEYVFTSEEYNEYVDSAFNDVFAFFVNGQNIALLPDGSTPVAINNVNCGNPYAPPGGSFCELYINNDLQDGGGALDTEMDGYTVVLTATVTVDPGVNHIKLAIADAGDRVLDSNVIIRGNSFLCTPPPPDAFLDIHPTSCPNPLNVRGRGALPAAILGFESFDVTEVDPSTLLLNGVAPLRWAYEDVATPLWEGEECDCTTMGPDGFMDLTLKFNMQEVAYTLGEVYFGDVLPVTISGVLLDGTAFEASDCVTIVGAAHAEDITE
jgi:hypothetical protein